MDEEQRAQTLRNLQGELRGELEHFQDLAQRNRTRAQRKRERIVLEREQQKRRCVVLRAGGRSGVRIAARTGIGRQTLLRWHREDALFRTAYDAVYDAWKRGDDQAVNLLLKAYRPEKPGKVRLTNDQDQPLMAGLASR